MSTSATDNRRTWRPKILPYLDYSLPSKYPSSGLRLIYPPVLGNASITFFLGAKAGRNHLLVRGEGKQPWESGKQMEKPAGKREGREKEVQKQNLETSQFNLQHP
jgi:hypothetical protein